ncbi:DUF1651 domain-containing protein [Synechococcus sp. BIOS-E4-1]|uniref:DUF1651 domain-containing protein n=1 Tax=Synechococcus sp. BIOS-E4-1 TaxID=1400864 RepID=UPI0016446681|nr:DUF1651 domain-containing protein [Synechococcus sp. BIOS-E4-1]
MQEGWLIDNNSYWSVRFHRDQKSWIRDPYVFVDHGRRMPNGEPALLKSRRYLRLDEATLLWKDLRSYGWQVTAPVWGEDVDV